MSHDQFAVLSTQAVAAAGVTYFIALLAHLWQWVLLRRVGAAKTASASAEQPAEQKVLAGVGAGGASAPAEPAGPAEDADAERDRERAHVFGRIGVAVTIVALVVHFVADLSRGLAANPIRVPWSNMYEFTLTATFFVVLAYLLCYRKLKLDWLAPVVTGFVLCTLMLDDLVLYEPVVPLRDSLQSPWLVVHVVAAILATAAFTIGGMASILYLIKARWPNTRPGGYLARVPGLDVLDRTAYRMHAFAFPVWTFAALIAGPIWAQHAWGRYWNWDPKEVWAFITWVVYAAYLHARATAGWKGKAAAIVALVGLATLWFNFVGINFFFGSGSMHSYA